MFCIILSKSLILLARSTAFIDCWNVLVIFAACDLYLTNSDSAQRSIISRKFQNSRKLYVVNIIDMENALFHHNSVQTRSKKFLPDPKFNPKFRTCPDSGHSGHDNHILGETRVLGSALFKFH